MNNQLWESMWNTPSLRNHWTQFCNNYCPASQEWQWLHFCLQSYQGLKIKRSLVYYSYRRDRIKGIYLSKALTCMKIFLYKQKLLFCQEDQYLWPHCCRNNLYISHRSLYAPTYSFWAIRSMLISLFRVTSWSDTVYNVETRWRNFRKNPLHIHELQLSDYNI